MKEHTFFCIPTTDIREKKQYSGKQKLRYTTYLKSYTLPSKTLKIYVKRDAKDWSRDFLRFAVQKNAMLKASSMYLYTPIRFLERNNMHLIHKRIRAEDTETNSDIKSHLLLTITSFCTLLIIDTGQKNVDIYFHQFLSCILFFSINLLAIQRSPVY